MKFNVEDKLEELRDETGESETIHRLSIVEVLYHP